MMSLRKHIVFTSLLLVLMPACAKELKIKELKIVECDINVSEVVKLKDAYFNSALDPKSFPAELFTQKYWNAVKRKKKSLSRPKDLANFKLSIFTHITPEYNQVLSSREFQYHCTSGGTVLITYLYDIMEEDSEIRLGSLIAILEESQWKLEVMIAVSPSTMNRVDTLDIFSRRGESRLTEQGYFNLFSHLPHSN